MKWIIVAIVLFIVPYTFLTLRYRKPGPAFQPYEDMKNRANVSRLLAAGYQRIPLQAQRPAEPGRVPGGASAAAVAGGIPEALRSTLVEAPLLPREIMSVAAASSASVTQPYAVQFTCTLPSDQQQLGGADLYVRGSELVFAPTFERISGNLIVRSRYAGVLLTVPPGALKPGHYTATVLAEQTSRSWSVEIR